jgi:hypothetical protein
MAQKVTIHRDIIALGQSITKVVTVKRPNFHLCANNSILVLSTILLH